MKNIIAILLTGACCFVNAAEMKAFNDRYECEKLQREFALGQVGQKLFAGSHNGPFLYQGNIINFRCDNIDEKWYWHSSKPFVLIETQYEYENRVAREKRESEERIAVRSQQIRQEVDRLLGAK